MAEISDEGCARIDRQKNFLENRIRDRDAIPSCVFGVRVMHREIERRERELPSIKNTGGRFLGVVHFLNDVARNFFGRIAIISRESIEHFFVPHPILEHL